MPAALPSERPAALPVAPAPPIDVVAPVGGAGETVGRAGWQLGAMALHRVTGRAARYRRTAQQIRRDFRDDWVLCVAASGTHRLRLAEAEATLAPGVPALLTLAQPFDGALHAADFLCLVVPRDAFPDLGPVFERCRQGPLDSAPGRLLAVFLHRLAGELPAMPEAEVPRAVEALHALLGAAAASGAAAAPVDRTVVQAAQLARVRSLIGQHLRSPELTPEMLCGITGMSRSQLYRLFEPQGGVAREIQRERLRQAHRAIADRSDGRSIQEIAEEFGFAEHAAFSRAFRRAFGYAPNAVRQGMQGGEGMAWPLAAG
jgi:AraC-like DNA-binding protein